MLLSNVKITFSQGVQQIFKKVFDSQTINEGTKFVVALFLKIDLGQILTLWLPSF